MGPTCRAPHRVGSIGLRLLVLVFMFGAGACTVSDVIVGVHETDLQEAIKAADVERVRALLASGAELGHTAAEPEDAWTLALFQLTPSDPRTVEVLRLVIPRAAEARGGGTAGLVNEGRSRPTSQGGRSRTTVYPAWIAAHKWSAEGLRVLVEHGLDPAGPGTANAMTTASGNGCEPCLQVLLDAGASPAAVDSAGDTPLAMARRVRNAKGVALLVSRGATAAPDEPPGALTRIAVGAARMVFGPLDDQGAEARETWVEGSAIATHPVGKALLEHAARSQAEGGYDGRVPDQEAVRRGLAAGSVLVVKGATADLHFVRFGEPGQGGHAGTAPTTITLSFESAGGAWRLAN